MHSIFCKLIEFVTICSTKYSIICLYFMQFLNPMLLDKSNTLSFKKSSTSILSLVLVVVDCKSKGLWSHQDCKSVQKLSLVHWGVRHLAALKGCTLCFILIDIKPEIQFTWCVPWMYMEKFLGKGGLKNETEWSFGGPWLLHVNVPQNWGNL